MPELMPGRYSGIFAPTNTTKLRKILFLVFVLITLVLAYNGLRFYRRPGQLSSNEQEKSQSDPPLPLQEVASNSRTKPASRISPHKNSNDVGLVISKTREEDVGWVTSFCRDFACTPYIYTVDEQPEEGFLIPHTNVGHEASAYLTYLVEHYYDLHPYTIFIHGKEEHWHNDVGGPKTFNQLPSLRFEAVSHKGFVNLRCLTSPGCPDSLHPSIIQQTDIDHQNLVNNFPKIWSEIFGVDPSTAPLQLGHHCCGQFAVTKERIRQKPLNDYDQILQWVAKAEWSDSYGIGWLMEKLWHVIFGMPAVNCGPVDQCRCDLYGWCGPNPETGGAILTPISY